MVLNEKIKEIIQKYDEHIMSQAFLIETNNVENCLENVKELVKYILCPHNFTKECQISCNYCHLIDNNSMPSLIIVDSYDGNIKKEQINDLRKNIIKKSIYTEYLIYIILNAEKLNKFSANSLLKTIEEPVEKTVGFFITTDASKIIGTIRSRCQIYRINFEKSEETNFLSIPREKYEYMFSAVSKFIQNLEEEPSSILVNNELLDEFKERADIEYILKIMISIYQEVLNNKIANKKSDNFNFLMQLNLKKIERKLKILYDGVERLKFNPNLELFFEYIAIEMGKLDE